MTSAIIVGDIHLSDRPPTSRVPGYAEQILAKLNFAAKAAKEREIPLVLAGDVFHLKAASKNSHRLVQATHEALEDVPTWIVPGNHDLAGDRLDSLPSQPLGSLTRMENVSLLLGEDERLPGITGLPYLTEFDGGDWETAVNNFTEKVWWPKGKERQLLVTHAPLFPPGQAPGVYASIDSEDWAKKFSDFSATYYGHIHDYHGVYEVAGHTFCNQGALSRGSLHESSVSRIPAVTIWDGDSFDRLEVSYLPASEVFLSGVAEGRKEEVASAQRFAEALGKTVLTTLTIEEIRDTLRAEVTDSNVMAVIYECLEAVQ